MKKANPPAKTTKPARAGGSRGAKKPASDQPETVNRYSGVGWCLLCIDKQLAEGMGAERTKALVDELGKRVLNLVYQDDDAVVNIHLAVDAEIQ